MTGELPILPNPHQQQRLLSDISRNRATAKIVQGDEAKEKRPKACTLCRRSKVKCEKDSNDESCKRCRAQNLQCVYEYKIASYKVVGDASTKEVSKIVKSPPKPASKLASAQPSPMPNASSSRTASLSHILNPPQPKPGAGWHSSVEDRLQDFGSKLGNILTILQTPESPSRPMLVKASSEGAPRNGAEPQSLSDILLLSEAEELFRFFDSNISPQLFGFNISQYSVNELWTHSPLLLASVCAIASIHHPLLSHLFRQLEQLIHKMSQHLLVRVPTTELDTFNTVLALCFCAFWFQENQMFTGMALQLASNLKLNKLSKNSQVSDKNKLKLWYLLYILDGQQSLVFNRQPLMNSQDKTLKESRSLLLEDDTDGAAPDENYSNLRLVSQVEYNQAISKVFEGDAWDLMAPASFGLPFKTNLELDKWMVQWTVMLSPFNNAPIWSSKSTLIYYNFAKMHINSAAVRSLHMEGDELPRWEEVESDQIANLEEGQNILQREVSDDDDDDHYELELSPQQSRMVSTEMALSSAETVLNLVLADTDILSALKYAPVHIHVMLYYAAMLVLNPPEYLSSKEKSFEDTLNAVAIVKKLRSVILGNLPIDKSFSSKLIEALSRLLQERVKKLKEDISDEQKVELDRVLMNNDTTSFTKKRTRQISAWPGYDHGHPSKKRAVENSDP
ncbi:hypothetical protein KL930_000686 [Ogataea haglerorum]|nr:hypothetical protein KL915_000688 [Ogataea haglerorum]KAG7745622.1 hypothetical protein KL932_000652 [Ogataea haglerorum]KAG7781508.1 hypothetical protein KL922_000430 [Ogataea haglerorum]KAG7782224.1 hypothetical protein KL930_000686 [Ogataea haglerorum]